MDLFLDYQYPLGHMLEFLARVLQFSAQFGAIWNCHFWNEYCCYSSFKYSCYDACRHPLVHVRTTGPHHHRPVPPPPDWTSCHLPHSLPPRPTPTFDLLRHQEHYNFDDFQRLSNFQLQDPATPQYYSCTLGQTQSQYLNLIGPPKSTLGVSAYYYLLYSFLQVTGWCRHRIQILANIFIRFSHPERS